MGASAPVKAYLETERGAQIPCLFNPAKLQVAKSNGWTGGDASTMLRREAMPTSAIPDTDESGGSDTAPALSPAQLSAIIRAVEDRLLEEIERRGGLSRRAF